MTTQPRTLDVMLLDDCAERAAELERELSSIGYRVVAHVSAGENLHSAFAHYRPDVIVADMESPDRDTLEHMRTISEQDPRPIVMFTNDDDQNTIRRAVQAGVSAYIADGTNARRVRPILDAAIARFEQYQAIRTELRKTQNTLAERKVIEQAKGLLMQKRGVDEPTAYRAMQKMAMDRNLRLVDLARSIIAAADLLA